MLQANTAAWKGAAVAPATLLLSWDRLYANAQASSLFRWAATLKELTIENPYVALRRFEDGAVNQLRYDLMAGSVVVEDGVARRERRDDEQRDVRHDEQPDQLRRRHHHRSGACGHAGSG